jgi:hypothetical protein
MRIMDHLHRRLVHLRRPTTHKTLEWISIKDEGVWRGHYLIEISADEVFFFG